MKPNQEFIVTGGESYHDIPIGSTVRIIRPDVSLVLVAFDERVYYLKPRDLKRKSR